MDVTQAQPPSSRKRHDMTTMIPARATRPAAPSPGSPVPSDPPPSTGLAMPKCVPLGEPTITARATGDPMPTLEAPGRAYPLTSHAVADTQRRAAGEGTNHPDSQMVLDAHVCPAVEVRTQPAEARDGSTSNSAAPRLADPSLMLAAEVVDDLERIRIANENRLRALTRGRCPEGCEHRDEDRKRKDEGRCLLDKDGGMRGFGLTLDHPDVARLAAIVEAIARLEHDATLGLQRHVRRHPLGGWVKATKGIGEKQGARLIAAVGDPYWNDLHQRPRTVSELWAYCGLHTLPTDQVTPDAHKRLVGGAQTSDPGQDGPDAQWSAAWVAAKRRKGQQANWSSTAKMRAYLCAEACTKVLRAPCGKSDDETWATHVDGCDCSPFRLVYDKRRRATVDRIHVTPCIRCGPSGSPAPAESPWSDGHKHADALRVTSKEILKDLWWSARELHQK